MNKFPKRKIKKELLNRKCTYIYIRVNKFNHFADTALHSAEGITPLAIYIIVH